MRHQLRANSDTSLGSSDPLAAVATLDCNHTCYAKPAPRLLLGNEYTVAAATQIFHDASFAISAIVTQLVIGCPVEGPRISPPEYCEGPQYAIDSPSHRETLFATWLRTI